MWSSLLFAPLFILLLAIYAQLRLESASEIELVLVNLSFIVFILFPRLRSRLLRRRTFVNAWLQEEHWLSRLLQGGSIYMSIQLIFVVPVAFILLIELHLITYTCWIMFTLLAGISALLRSLVHRYLSALLQPTASSVLAREWATYFFSAGCAVILFYQALYTERLNLSDRALQDALLYTSQNISIGSEGLIGDLIFMRSLKETTFWWSITKLPELLDGLPSTIIWLSKTGLIFIYSFYQLSVVYAFSLWFAGSLECTDPSFYHFLKGERSTLKVQK